MNWLEINKKSFVEFVRREGTEHLRFIVPNIPETEFMIDETVHPIGSEKLCLKPSRDGRKKVALNLDNLIPLIREGDIKVEIKPAFLPLTESCASPVSKL